MTAIVKHRIPQVRRTAASKFAPVVHSENRHWLLWVGLRRPSVRIHRQKAGVEGSMPVSRHSRMGHFDPELTYKSSIKMPESGRPDLTVAGSAIPVRLHQTPASIFSLSVHSLSAASSSQACASTPRNRAKGLAGSVGAAMSQSSQ